MVVSGSDKSFTYIRGKNVFQFKTKTNSTLSSSQQATNNGESKISESHDFRLMLSKFLWFRIVSLKNKLLQKIWAWPCTLILGIYSLRSVCFPLNLRWVWSSLSEKRQSFNITSAGMKNWIPWELCEQQN